LLIFTVPASANISTLKKELARKMRPLWVTTEGPSQNASIILRHLENSYKDGLNPDDYNVSKILKIWPSRTLNSLAELDTLLTFNLVKYVHDISFGQLKWFGTDPVLFAEAENPKFNPPQTIQEILAKPDLDKYLNGLPPSHSHYTALRSALEQYRGIAATGGWNHIPEGKTLRPGEQDDRVVLIRKRLQKTRDLDSRLPTSALYNGDLKTAVITFQRRHGLYPDGLVGRKTLAAMNIPVTQLIDTIRINMARWRWSDHELGPKYILVNIAGYNLKAFNGETVVLNFPVIVGQQQHQTPVFSAQIKYLDFNPFWNVTPSIAKNEDLPKLRKNPNYLVERHVRLFSNWQADAIELDSKSINWSMVSINQMNSFKLRQDPGPWNALGRVKFMFPNRFSVYMHDTPGHDLFSHTKRDFSHGCIRISDPLALAIFVLDGEKGGWNKQTVEAVFNQDSRKIISLRTPLPIHITYQTTWIDKEGLIHFNDDIYGRDAKLYYALIKKENSVD
jgi:L,D-transpeptidase YcbB